jgi:hypothetical protein
MIRFIEGRPAAHCLDRQYEPQPSVGTAGLDGFASALHTKNDVNDALHLIEPLRVQFVGHLDVLMVLPGDLEGEAVGVNRMSRSRKSPE